MGKLAWQTLVDGDRCRMDAPRAPETRVISSDRETLRRQLRDAWR